MVKRWTGSVVFAPAQSESDRLAITTLKAWRLKEPVSARRYTVVKLESRGGAAGYGECGPSVASEIAEAKKAILGKRATDAEFIRHRLASGSRDGSRGQQRDARSRCARSKCAHISVSGRPDAIQGACGSALEGDDEEALANSVERGMEQGARAFSFPIPTA